MYKDNSALTFHLDRAIAECPTAWERAVDSVNCTCLSWELVKFCVCPSFRFGIEGGMWDVMVLIPDHCLSIYFLY